MSHIYIPVVEMMSGIYGVWWLLHHPLPLIAILIITVITPADVDVPTELHKLLRHQSEETHGKKFKCDYLHLIINWSCSCWGNILPCWCFYPSP